MADVHRDDDDRTRAVRAERASADQEPGDEAPVELRLLVHAWEDRTAPDSA